MKREIIIIITLCLITFSGCSLREDTFKSAFGRKNRQYYKEKNLQYYNCGGFVIDKIDKIKRDSVYLNVNISSCIDGLGIPYATIWVKSRTNQEKKFTCDKKGNITLPLELGYYSIKASAINYNTVYTPILTLFPINYSLKIYLGGGDPLID